MNDLLAGVIPLLVASSFAAEAHIQSGKVRALVTTSETRLPRIDQVPTLSEALPGIEVELWLAVFVPAGVPQAVADKLSNALKTVLSDPQVAEQMERVGTLPRRLAPADLKEMMEKEEARWAGVIKKAGITAE